MTTSPPTNNPCLHHLKHHGRHITLFSLILQLVLPRQVQATLTFLPFDKSLTCADGSPYGIYVENDNATPLSESQDHILVLMGGGSCANPDDCRKDYEERPFVFSSSFNPETIKGDASKGRVGDFIHMGSLLLHEVFSFWSNKVFQARKEGINSESPLHNVVVVGISAGAVGLMNHIPTVRSAVDQIGANNLNFLLDAPSVVSDHGYVGKDFNEAMEYYVDVKDEFPLCSQSHPFSGLYDSVSELPCCLSTHCLMRHDKQGLASFILHDNPSSNQSITLEKLLLLDSAYDPVALIGGTNFLQTDTSAMGMGDMEITNAEGAWTMMESAGGQKV